MTLDRFNEILEEQLNRCRAILVVKDKEYARQEDRLHNFKNAARKRNTTPEDVLRGMTIKHTVSIDDIVMDLKEDKLPSIATLDEKITDEINYLILLKALILERMER